MTEAKKKIIELISDYMDKTVTDGCLMEYQDNKLIELGLNDEDTPNRIVCLAKNIKGTHLDLSDDATRHKNTLYLLSDDAYQCCIINHYGDLELKVGFVYKDIEIVKILGHYCLTAVLKYIGDADIGDLEMFLDIDDGISFGYSIYNEISNDSDYFESCIPNKPLHLYTEQEEKDLLELLTKLKGQD